MERFRKLSNLCLLVWSIEFFWKRVRCRCYLRTWGQIPLLFRFRRRKIKINSFRFAPISTKRKHRKIVFPDYSFKVLTTKERPLLAPCANLLIPLSAQLMITHTHTNHHISVTLTKKCSSTSWYSSSTSWWTWPRAGGWWSATTSTCRHASATSTYTRTRSSGRRTPGTWGRSTWTR